MTFSLHKTILIHRINDQWIEPVSCSKTCFLKYDSMTQKSLAFRKCLRAALSECQLYVQAGFKLVNNTWITDSTGKKRCSIGRLTETLLWRAAMLDHLISNFVKPINFDIMHLSNSLNFLCNCFVKILQFFFYLTLLTFGLTWSHFLNRFCWESCAGYVRSMGFVSNVLAFGLAILGLAFD